MDTPRNEVDPSDTTDYAAKPPAGFAVGLVAGLHVLCCGLPLLLLSGVSLTTLLPKWPAIAIVLAALGLVGFVWYLRKGCATCPGNPKTCRARHSREFIGLEGERNAGSSGRH